MAVSPGGRPHADLESPSPKSGTMPLSSVREDYAVNAEAGPSVDRSRRGSTNPSPPHSPSSAPPTPSIINLVHPPTYIHTHHPRRGSMIPLGLNVISPIAPFSVGGSQPSPVRTMGFSPNSTPQDIPQQPGNVRRGSAASSSSTLTQSRPLGMSPSNGNLPAGFNRERRRSSLTPQGPTLAPPSPSRTHVSGRMARPTTSDGSTAKPMMPRTRTGENIRPHAPLGSSPLSGQSASPDAAYARRGSMPQLHYGGWTGPSHRAPWNPSLPPQRSSVGDGNEETPVVGAAPIGEGFKFGALAGSPAEASLRAASRRTSAATNSSKARADMDVFEQAEADEAERQRKAFLAATYGQDGKRARERLSLGGPQMAPGLPHSSASSSNLRRQSLMLWEKLNTQQASSRLSGEGSEVSLQSAPPVALSHAGLPFGDEVDGRRGSLPIAIPSLGRTLSKRSHQGDNFDKPPAIITGDATTEEEDEVEEEVEGGGDDGRPESDPHRGMRLQRPMPPLLPLSDPGPRLLNSTLALHRANHLLTSRNLQAEPLPHPLPPSLHPPAPVGLSEFDLDFIIAGSRAQLGGDMRNRNAPVDVSNPQDSVPVPATPTLKLGPGGEDEDSFAKFVGKFDDEYGDRRGGWTFRACPRSTSQTHKLSNPDSTIKAEWDCIGAGKFEITESGHVRSIQTGSEWCIRRNGPREFQLHEVNHAHEHQSHNHSPDPQDESNKPTIIASGQQYILASKTAHREAGGVKLAAHSDGSWLPAKKERMNSAATSATTPKLRVSISDSMHSDRTARIGSTDSGSTARMPSNLSSSAPLTGLGALGGKKPRQYSKGEDDRGRNSSHVSSKARARSGDRNEEEKNKKGLGGVFKKGFMSSLKPSNLVAAAEEKRAQKEEKAREKGQSHSWSPSQSHRSNFVQPSNQNFTRSNPGSYRSGLPERTSSSNVVPGSVHTTPRSYQSEDRIAQPPGGVLNPLTEEARSWASAHSSPYMGPAEEGGEVPIKEGKAWNPVVEEAVAMVIPIENDEHGSPSERPRSITEHRQGLLVWWVPFNSELPDDQRDKASGSSVADSTKSPSIDSYVSHHSQTSSIPKLQKLLRRRASKDKEGLKQRDGSGILQSKEDKNAALLHPLPFRSFRVVARVVDCEDLTDLSSLGPSFGDWQQSMIPASIKGAASSSSSPIHLVPSLPGTDEIETASSSTAPTSTILAGRTFPTVIAVCHSRSQGVEFVLEGLDRLGFCVGESAWGPTGYEEWRGSGLSAKGRELLDLLWAGCTGVMGLTGA